MIRWHDQGGLEKQSSRGNPSESYGHMNFVLFRVANPTIVQAPYERGAFVVYGHVCAWKDRRKVHSVTR